LERSCSSINQETGAIQPAGGAGCDLFQRDVCISSGRRGLVRLRRIIYHQFAGRVVVEKALAALDAGLCIDRPFRSFIFYHRGDDTLRGVFCRKMLAQLKTLAPESEEYRTYELALKYGLAALQDRPVTDYSEEER